MDLADEISGLSLHSRRPVYWAVKRGWRPGVYLTAEACESQINGFPNCLSRTFRNCDEALAWVHGSEGPSLNPLLEPQPLPSNLEASKHFYAVRKGYNPGIYRHHLQLKNQISGFSRPEHKKCQTLKQAQEFMLENEPTAAPPQPQVVKTGVFRVHEPTFYEPEPQVDEYIAVRKGKNPGIYVTPSLAERQSKGIRYKQTKKFPTMEEAVEYLHGYHFNTNKFHAVRGPRNKKVVFFDAKQALEMMERVPSADYEVFGSMVEANLWLRRKTCDFWVETRKKTHNIFVDGCCLGNGRADARAGYGVHWEGKQDWCGEARGKSNNAAELEAILNALRKITEECAGDVFNLYSDSEYAINCVTIWGDNWEKNGWRTSDGGSVKNARLIRLTRAKLRELKLRRYDDFHLLKVAGHAGIPGNERADELANLGANGIECV